MSYKRKRITVKIGSNVLARPDGTLDITRMSALTDQIAELHKAGVEIIVISSGAVASGRSELKIHQATGEEHYYYDYRIGSDKSDAIGKGNPDFAIFPLDKDMYGNLRSTSVDIGAYQYIPQEIPEE